MSATQVELGKVAQFINGAAFKPEDWGDEGKKIIRIQNLTDQSKPYNKTLRQVDSKLVVERGDLLVSWSATLGVFEWTDEDALLNQHIFRVVPDLHRVDKNYLKHSLKNAITEMDKHLHGATMKHINRGAFLATKIPLPPLVEQKRIAAILEKAAEIKAKREQAIAKLDELAQSTFVEMFGSSIENEGVELRSICDRVTDGTHQSPEWVDGGIPFIFISNIVNGEINLKTNKFISNNTYEELTRNCQINVGDILYTTVGSYGNVALVRDESKFAFQRHIAHIKPKQDIVNSRFMATMLGCTFVRRQVDKVARGVAQKTVNLGDLAKLKVICPPIKLQQEFAKRVELIETLKVKQIKASVSATQLISSLQHQAFTTGFNA